MSHGHQGSSADDKGAEVIPRASKVAVLMEAGKGLVRAHGAVVPLRRRAAASSTASLRPRRMDFTRVTAWRQHGSKVSRRFAIEKTARLRSRAFKAGDSLLHATASTTMDWEGGRATSRV